MSDNAALRGDMSTIGTDLDDIQATLVTVSADAALIAKLEKDAIEYNFTAYSKAVMLFYEADRPFPGDPYAWCYVYTAAGGNPSNTTEIAKRDRVKIWATEQPV
jgi:hypothetical protein